MREVRNRLATLEECVARLSASPSTAGSSDGHPGRPLSKRSHEEAFHQDQSRTPLTPLTIGDRSCEPSPFSTYEAQIMIELGMRQLPHTSRIEQEAFLTALSTLRRSLDFTSKSHDKELPLTPVDFRVLPVPSVETIQWMLHCKDLTRFSSSKH